MPSVRKRSRAAALRAGKGGRMKLVMVLWWVWFICNVGVQTYVLTWPDAHWLAKVMAVLAGIATVVADIVIRVWIRRTF